MSDAKEGYSEAAQYFVQVTTAQNDALRHAYEHSKWRESQYGKDWEDRSVNINVIVDMFAPGSRGRASGMKYVFEGPEADVIADMSTGYLRIRNRTTRQWLKLNGKPESRPETHFKILKRGEM